MNETLRNEYKTNNSGSQAANAKLIYSYTESLLKAQSESLNRIDTKFNWMLAASGVLLKFAIDLPPGSEDLAGFDCLSCAILKLGVCVTAGLAATFSALGLTARFSGEYPAPKALMNDEHYTLPEETLRCKIINSWVITEKQYREIAIKKTKQLNVAIRLICAGICAFAIDIALVTFLGKNP